MSGDRFTFHLAQPHSELLRMEAEHNHRTLDAHLKFVLDERYTNLLRVCGCGHFVFDPAEGRNCMECSEPCCVHCSVMMGDETLCGNCTGRRRISQADQ